MRITTSMFGKHPTMSIYEGDDKSPPLTIEDKPIVSFGLKKAEAIIACIDRIKKFVETKGKSA